MYTAPPNQVATQKNLFSEKGAGRVHALFEGRPSVAEDSRSVKGPMKRHSSELQRLGGLKVVNNSHSPKHAETTHVSTEKTVFRGSTQKKVLGILAKE